MQVSIVQQYRDTDPGGIRRDIFVPGMETSCCLFILLFTTAVIVIVYKSDIIHIGISYLQVSGTVLSSFASTSEPNNFRKMRDKKNTNSLKKVTSVCTHKLFRAVSRTRDYFPSGGKWTALNVADQQAEYFPESCRFRWKRIPPQYLKSCLRKTNMKYFVTIGDSNAARYFEAFQRHFSGALNGCASTRQERMDNRGYTPDRNYFSRENSSLAAMLRVSKRSCHTCASREIRCEIDTLENALLRNRNNKTGVILEQIAMSKIIDRSITLKSNASNTSDPSRTFQEYIFRNYFKSRSPDILVIFLPFNHAKMHGPIANLTRDIQLFVNILEMNLGNRTSIFWMPAFREFEGFRRGIKRYEGLLAWQKIDRLNHVLYDVIKSRLTLRSASRRFYGFLDLIEASKNRGHWTFDARHMLPVWYDIMTSYFLEMMCQELTKN